MKKCIVVAVWVYAHSYVQDIPCETPIPVTGIGRTTHPSSKKYLYTQDIGITGFAPFTPG